ncbi:S8 family serine peptidase [Neobacillus sp.]|uniref:S8 family serine peptidase n=1 Tax=Neobacillus sp. TaxID=2675273 RepID=UPI0035B50867
MSLKSLKRNKKRKISTYALAAALILSNFSFVPSASAESPKKDYRPLIEQYKKKLQEKSGEKQKLGKLLKEKYKGSEKVRVIVELEGKTPVELATEQGKLYKELPETKIASITANLEKQQKNIKEKIKSKGVQFTYKKHFSTAFNGFSGELSIDDISKLEEINGVKHIYLANEYKRPEIKPNMVKSKSLFQTSQTWVDAGLRGEGMVVSVIDTGIDPTHPDFVLTDKSKAELTKKEVEEIVKQEGLKGKFYTEKVPYGYNYFDQNDTIIDKGTDTGAHGMHVAGIVAANGDETDGGIKGVAPEAQVLAMKVFSNDPLFPSTWSDVCLAAIDDSIKLGADVLNMSLGEIASFYNEQSAEEVAIQRAAENGIVSTMAAGNSGTISYGWEKPFYKNPDIGVVEAPGIYKDGISVAAANNIFSQYEHSITINGFTAVGYGIDDWTSVISKGKSLQMVSLKGAYGMPEDYEAVDVIGKVVLVKRGGGLSLADKAFIAEEMGAAGIIVYDDGSSVFYKNQGGFGIPFMMVSKKDGESLEKAMTLGNTSIHVKQIGKKDAPESGKMTEFSSWGTTPSLGLKPEITAPGGGILSTLNHGEYGEYSGTSMASPHVAGGGALVQQYLQKDKRFTGLSASERSHLAKTLLMNTAKIIENTNGQPYSPRLQGAGMMQTYNAVKTPVYVVNKTTGEAKVELKDFTKKNFEMTLVAKNISDKNVSYKVNTKVLTDTLQKNSKGEDYNALIAGALVGAKVNGPKTITVPAGKSKEFTIKVDISSAKVPAIDTAGKQTTVQIKEDMFVEGFITLEDVDKTEKGKMELSPDLTIPFVGFYGRWDRPSILDGMKDLGESRYFDLQGMFDEEDEEGTVVEVPVHDMLSDDWFIAPVPEKGFYAISPNGDMTYEDINILPSFMRNAAEAQFNILDKDKKLLRRVQMEKNVVKSYYSEGLGVPYSYNPGRTWDGKVKGQIVKDGLYYYQVKSVIDYDGASYQTKEIPIMIDTTPPSVKVSYNPKTSVVSWSADEKGSGIQSYAIFVDDEMVDEVDADVNSYKLTDVPKGSFINIIAVDYALNFGAASAVNGKVEDQEPVIMLLEPEPYGVYQSKKVKVSGVVLEDFDLKSVTVNGKVVNFKQAEQRTYSFDTTVTFDKDGLYDIIVQADDKARNKASLARKVFIDTTPPNIRVDFPSIVPESMEELTLKLNATDNFNYLSLFVNDSHEFEKAIVGPVDLAVPANETITVKVPLDVGENVISLQLKDLGGNITTKKLTVNRGNFTGWKFINGSWYYYKNNVKQTGWVFDKSWYYLDKDGKMKTGWIKDGKHWYYLKNSGAMVTGWYKVGNIWYYFQQSGTMKTGWVHVNGKWYYLKSSGAMATGWVKDGKRWYYLDQSGAMKMGWLRDNRGKWYYLNKSGDMAVGWKLISGKWYYFYQSGEMAANTRVDGYKLGPDGAWIK